MSLAMYLVYDVFFFFFKQKTAYEMLISDWSSDVCSSDLVHAGPYRAGALCAADRQLYLPALGCGLGARRRALLPDLLRRGDDRVGQAALRRLRAAGQAAPVCAAGGGFPAAGCRAPAPRRRRLGRLEAPPATALRPCRRCAACPRRRPRVFS